jgi:hypothetical protein
MKYVIHFHKINIAMVFRSVHDNIHLNRVLTGGEMSLGACHYASTMRIKWGMGQVIACGGIKCKTWGGEMTGEGEWASSHQK